MSIDITRRGAIVGCGAFASMLALGGAGRMLGAQEALRPPGAQDEDHFEATCLTCNRCIDACPQGCLRTGLLEDGLLSWRTPVIDYHRGLCDFCGKCEAVCPTTSIKGVADGESVIGVAVIDHDRCIAWMQKGCQVCVEACPYGAISLDSAGRPVVDESACNGCGACEYKCPSNSYLTAAGGTARGVNVVANSARSTAYAGATRNES